MRERSGYDGHFYRAAVVTVLALNVIVFAYESSLDGVARFAFEHRYGAVPVALRNAYEDWRTQGVSARVLRAALPFLTANFLHADIMHIGMNMVFYWIFANTVARVIGPVRFLVLYGVAGALAVLVFAHASPDSRAPMVGASGAIAGLEGGYFVLLLLWELPPVNVWPLASAQPPARLALIALASFALDARAFFGHLQSHIAFGAHVGGFVGGAFVALVFGTLSRPTFRP